MQATLQKAELGLVAGVFALVLAVFVRGYRLTEDGRLISLAGTAQSQ